LQQLRCRSQAFIEHPSAKVVPFGDKKWWTQRWTGHNFADTNVPVRWPVFDNYHRTLQRHENGSVRIKSGDLGLSRCVSGEVTPHRAYWANEKTQRRRTTEHEMQTERAIRHLLK
jgi:hypothetical protein